MELEPIVALEQFDPDALPPDRLADVVYAAANAAEGLFRAGDLDRSLAVWDLVIRTVDLHPDLDPRGHLSGYVAGRARTLDHLDDLEGALAGYERWRALEEPSGRTNMLRWADAAIARIRRKIAKRDAGLPYPTHHRGPRPEALAWEAYRFRERLSRLPAWWEARDAREAERAVETKRRKAREAEDAAWRAAADPAIVAEYDAIQAEMRDLAGRLFTISTGVMPNEMGRDELTAQMEMDPEIDARGRALGRRARELRERPLRQR